MIIGIGCDIVDHITTRELNWSSDRVLSRIFTAKEIELYRIDPTDRFLSGRFACKESVLKCLGTGMRDKLALTDIEILRTKAGQPQLTLYGEVEALANQMSVRTWHITISHNNTSSVAFVIAES